MTTTIEVEADDAGTGRYVLTVDGDEAGELTFRPDPTGNRVLIHTGVKDEFEGQGLAAKLVNRAFDDARAAGIKIVPQCPYVRRYLERHPEQLDVVAP